MRNAAIIVFATLTLALSSAWGDSKQVQAKVEQVKSGIKQWHKDGRDTSSVRAMMKQVGEKASEGDLDAVESMLDEVLVVLAEDSPGVTNSNSPDQPFQANTEWNNPQKVEIIEYDKDAMEVGFSDDETQMFFNDKQEPNKDLHWAERVSDNEFRYMGKIKNVNTRATDASPTLDNNGKIYYTSIFEHDRIQKTGNYTSMYVAEIEDGKVRNPQPLTGDIYVRDRMWFSLDTDVSTDGDTIYFSQGHFEGTPPPSEFNIVVARRVQGNEYKVIEGMLDNVNTRDGLEYAPCISTDDKELYFTKLTWDNDNRKATFEGIFVAKRDSVDEPFGVPRKISAITGTVEAPSISKDGKTLYYHKLDGKRYKIYKVTRDLP